MQRSTHAHHSGAVGARPQAEPASAPAGTPLQRRASATSAAGSDHISIDSWSGSSTAGGHPQDDTLDSDSDASSAGFSTASASSRASHRSGAPGPGPLPPPMELLPADSDIAPFFWRHGVAHGVPQTAAGARPGPLPPAEGSGSSQSTGSSGSGSSAQAPSASTAPRPRPRRMSLSPLSPMRFTGAGREPLYSRRMSQASASDALSLISMGGRSPWLSAPVSFAPTPADAAAQSPVDSVSSTHSGPAATSYSSFDMARRQLPETDTGAVQASAIAGALAQLPPARSSVPQLRLDVSAAQRAAAASANTSPIAMVSAASWVDHSPEPMEAGETLPWSHEQATSRAASWLSPGVSPASRRPTRSTSVSSQLSTASDASAQSLQAMAQSTHSLASQISEISRPDSDNPRSQAWDRVIEGQQHAQQPGDEFGSEDAVSSAQSDEGMGLDLSSGPSSPSSEAGYFSQRSVGPASTDGGDGGGSDAGDSEAGSAFSYRSDLEDNLFSNAERTACLNSAVAVTRSLLLPTPLTHVARCLSRGGDHLAVLRPDPGGSSLMQLLWLGAPEKALPGVTAPRRPPTMPLNHGLTLDPPLGRRGAVPPPVVAEFSVEEPAGSVLLAALFSKDDPPKSLAAVAQEMALQGFVVAPRPLVPHTATQAVWHSGPGLDWKWRQPLQAVRQPQVRISPSGAALVLMSATVPQDPFSVAHVLDGVWLYIMDRVIHSDGPLPPGETRETGRWVLREPQSLVPPGSTLPTFAWTADDQCTVMASQSGLRVFDTRPTQRVRQLRQELYLPAPQALVRPPAQVAAGALSFDPGQNNVAVNWTSYGPDQQPLHRMAQVARLDVPRGLADEAPLLAPIWQAQPTFKPYEMIHFVGQTGDALWARANRSDVIYRPEPIDAPTEAYSRKFAGATQTSTRAKMGLLLSMGNSQGDVAILTRRGMRFYPDFETAARPALRRFRFTESNPHYIEALRAQHTLPSDNRVTLAPWFETSGRYLYLGFDGDVLQRYDVVPGRGRSVPNLYDRTYAWLAGLDIETTPWTLSDGPDAPPCDP